MSHVEADAGPSLTLSTLMARVAAGLPRLSGVAFGAGRLATARPNALRVKCRPFLFAPWRPHR